MMVVDQCHALANLLLVKLVRETLPIAQEVGWAPGPVWTGGENSPPLGFNPQTIQPIVSHYSTYTILAQALF
jgi:hypothetical protein